MDRFRARKETAGSSRSPSAVRRGTRRHTARAVPRGAKRRSGRLFGQEGNDTLKGIGYEDSLFGGNGDGRLDGGMGDDEMSGGAGDDLYLVG